MDRQARLQYASEKEWTSYGDVTHAEAASKHAQAERQRRQLREGWTLEDSLYVITRCVETPDCDFMHLVVFCDSPKEVISLR
jgi:hypothetical protein